MNSRKEFISEIKRLKRALADANRRLAELEELANPRCSLASGITIVPEAPLDGDENSFAANVAFGMSKIRVSSLI
jgi:hypothetical protein